MRREDETKWSEVGQVTNNSAKKKNLVNGVRYYFRVKPVGQGTKTQRASLPHTEERMSLSLRYTMVFDLSWHLSFSFLFSDIDDSHWTWSPGSEALSPLSLPPHMASMLGPNLIRKDGTNVPVEELAGKVIGKYEGGRE